MKVGIQWFNTDDTIGPSRMAQEVESRGFSSLFVTEHTHIPVSDSPPMPEVYGGVMPEFYKRSLDPFVALSFVAAATEHLRFGTAICLVAQRDVFVTAKAVASLDHLSSGRFEFGVGFGWNRDEAEASGVQWRQRFSIVRERVAAMKALWTEDEAEYRGQHTSFGPSWAWPKPIQRPHPPVLLGGGGPTSMRETIVWADSWMPAPRPDDPTLESTIPKFRRLAEDMGRDPATIGITVVTVPTELGAVEGLRRAGADEVLLAIYPTPGEQETLQALDAAAKLAAALC